MVPFFVFKLCNLEPNTLNLEIKHIENFGCSFEIIEHERRNCMRKEGGGGIAKVFFTCLN